MKSRFTSFFLVLFLIDSILTISQSLLHLTGINYFNEATPKTVRAFLSFMILPLAVVQLVISLRQKQKMSAKVLGLFPLVLALISLIVGIYFFIIKKTTFDPLEYLHTLSLYTIIGGIVQLSIGVWVARDLAKGHYFSKTQ